MQAFTYEEYGPPSVLQFREVKKPAVAPNYVLVKIAAVALNPADWRTLSSDPFFVRLENGLLKPQNDILGADIAGRVEAVGADVTQFKVGDEVFGDIGAGGFAEYASIPADKLAHKPAALSFTEAAAVPKAAITALQALRDHGRVQAGQKVLINGASGGVGTFAVQIAKAFGATVTGVCSARNREMVHSIGADYVLDYAQTDFADGHYTYDLILDLVGNRVIPDIQRALNTNGTALLIGFSTLGHMIKSILVGAWVSKRTQKTIKPMNATINTADLLTLQKMLTAGDIRPIIDQQYAFNKLPEAMAYLETGRARGKIVICVNSEEA